MSAVGQLLYLNEKQMLPLHCLQILTKPRNAEDLDHIRIKHDGKKIKCSECEKEFNLSNDRRIHMKSIHDGLVQGVRCFDICCLVLSNVGCVAWFCTW